MVGSASLKLENQKQQEMVLKFLDVILHELQQKIVSLTLDIKIAKIQLYPMIVHARNLYDWDLWIIFEDWIAQ